MRDRRRHWALRRGLDRRLHRFKDAYRLLPHARRATTIGTNRQECLPDALGSVVTTTIGGAATGKQIRYANYGGVIYDVGGFNRPRNAWVGSLGYRSTQVSHAEQYVRARHYSTTEARWTTVDPIWPARGKKNFVYAHASPLNYLDRTGLSPTIACVFSDLDIIGTLIDAYCDALSDPSYVQCVQTCERSSWGSQMYADVYIKCAKEFCNKGVIGCSGSKGRSAGPCVDPNVGGFASYHVDGCPITICVDNSYKTGLTANTFFNVLTHELGHCCEKPETYDADKDSSKWPLGQICNYATGACIGQKCTPNVPPHISQAFSKVVA